MADGKILPMIVICPTYNNESNTDSSSYSLALQLTDNYHNELINDLIPSVEGTYSTHADSTTPEGIIMRCDSDSGKKLIKSMVLRTADRQGMC